MLIELCMHSIFTLEMALYLRLILLLCSILAEGHQEHTETSTEETTAVENPLQAYFYWIRVGPTTLQLGWQVEKLVEKSIDRVRLTAESTSHPNSTKTKAANVSTGQITLKGLKPYTLYKVKVEATRNNTPAFNYTSYMETWPTAPSHVLPPEGRATSTTQIELRWSEPAQLNGILEFYRLACFKVNSGSAPVRVLTVDNKTTHATVDNLHPNTKYQCRLEVSTVPAHGQDPAECKGHSKLSSIIRTMTKGEEKGNITTSGSTTDSAICGIVFTCMTMVHALNLPFT